MFERFRALSASRQLLLIAAGVCIVSILLVSVWYFLLRTDYAPLFGNLRTADAATIVADLDKKKIPYRVADGGATILVPEDRVAATRLDVMSEDLPLKGTVGFELFNKSDMGLTDFTQKVNYQRALQGELERTIMTLDGVDSARVHLSMGEDRIFRDDRVPPKASVTIRMKNDAVLPVSAAQGIQRLVAAAVPKLDMSDVVILNEKGQVVGAPAQPVIAAEAATPEVQERHAIEQYYEARVREALETAQAGEGMTVTVRAGIAPGADADTLAQLQNWTPETRKFPLQVTLGSQAALDSQTQENLRTLALGAIGFAAANGDNISFTNGAEAQPANAAPDASSKDVQSAIPTPQAIDREPNWVEETALGLIPLLALVAFFLLIWRARGPRRLSEQQRSEFALKLRAALDKGGSHAASRL